MDFLQLISKNLYYFLLVLSTFMYSVSFFLKFKKFYPIAICLLVGLSCEFITFLIRFKGLLIDGEQNNSITGHIYTWISFLTFSYFIYKNMNKEKVKYVFKVIIICCCLLGITSQVSLDSYLISRDPWLPFILMIGLLILSGWSLYDLLNRPKGYPFIIIGIFLSSGSYLISKSVAGTYVNVDLDVWYFREFLGRIVLIMMYLLFMYELFLFFKKRNKTVLEI